MAEMERRIRGEMDNLSRQLTRRIKELAKCYASTLSQYEIEINEYEAMVKNIYRDGI